ncbi:MAG: ABC transporter permease [Chloroflexi bacterium]|nr:ABC transporter permease [Chloroflexota bacterium]
MKILGITRKTLLELWREPLLIGLLLLFPVLLVFFYYVAFGQTKDGLASYLKLLVMNDDAGPAGTALVEVICETEYNGDLVFDVAVVTDRNIAEIALREHKAALLLVIPTNFTQSLTTQETPPAVRLVGDVSSDTFVFAQGFLDDLVLRFARQVSGREEPALVMYEFLPGTGTMSDFDFGVPGTIVFGVMFMTIATAMIMVRERVNHTLRRLRLTRASARDLLLGVTLALLIVSLVQAPLTFGSAVLLGFHVQGSLVLAMGIVLLLSLSAVGLGLIVACFARNDGEAANLGAVVGVMMALLSDAMYPMPEAPIATIAGRTIELYDALPPTHAGEAMRRVLVFGEGPGAIVYELAMMATLAALFLTAGVILYRRVQMGERKA